MARKGLIKPAEGDDNCTQHDRIKESRKGAAAPEESRDQREPKGREKNKRSTKEKKGKDNGLQDEIEADEPNPSESEATVYEPAVRHVDSIDEFSNLIISNLEKLRNRVSNSSDEMQNTSDESENKLNNSLIGFAGKGQKFVEDGQQPHAS